MPLTYSPDSLRLRNVLSLDRDVQRCYSNKTEIRSDIILYTDITYYIDNITFGSIHWQYYIWQYYIWQYYIW